MRNCASPPVFGVSNQNQSKNILGAIKHKVEKIKAMQRKEQKLKR